mgnify:FL=1
MCFFGGGAKAAPAPKKAEFEDAPPVVTGKQTGVDDPKDTKKATDKLRMDRKKREGTYVDPTVNTNLERTTSLLTRSGGLGAKEKSERSARLRSGVSRGSRPPSKAQKMAAARKAMRSKR